MAYLTTIPAATDVPATSQAQILANFQAIKTLVDVNHGTFSAADQGKHKHVSLPEQAASPATAVNEVALFARQSALTGIAELCIRNENNGTVYEITSVGIGWTRLPSGILLKWGTTVANGATTITFPVAANIPVFTAVVAAQVSILDAGAGDVDQAIRVRGSNATQLLVYGSRRIALAAAAVNFEYLVIGY